MHFLIGYIIANMPMRLQTCYISHSVMYSLPRQKHMIRKLFDYELSIICNKALVSSEISPSENFAEKTGTHRLFRRLLRCADVLVASICYFAKVLELFSNFLQILKIVTGLSKRKGA